MNRSTNAGQRSVAISKPAAPAWPPYRMNRSRAGLERRAEIEAAVAPARGPDDRPQLRPDDGRPAELLDEPRRDEPDDPDRPRAADDRRGRVRRRRVLGRVRRRDGSADRSARASPIACFVRSRRLRFAASSSAASASASVRRPRASSSRAATSASPTRPAALIRGASANADRLHVDGRGRDAGRGEERHDPRPRLRRSRSRPSRTIARVSPRIGTTSATLPIVARSVSARAASGPPGSSARSSWASLKATPLPASRRSG